MNIIVTILIKQYDKVIKSNIVKMFLESYIGARNNVKKKVKFY